MLCRGSMVQGTNNDLERLIREVRSARLRLEETIGRSQGLILTFDALQAPCEQVRSTVGLLVRLTSARRAHSVQ